MAEGTVEIGFKTTGVAQATGAFDNIKQAAQETEGSVDALNERMQRLRKYQKAGLISGQDVAVLQTRARNLSAQRLAGAGNSHVVSKEAQLLAQAGGKFSAGMSAGAASLNYAARIMGDSSGALAKVAANVSSLGAIGAGGMSIAQAGGTVGAVGKVTLGIGASLVGYDIGKAIGDWLIGFFDETTTDEYKEKAARVMARARRKNQNAFAEASFDRELSGMKTSAEVSAKLKALEDELFNRAEQFNRGLDGSRENQDAIDRIEKQIIALKQKQAALLTQENSKKQADIIADRNKDLVKDFSGFDKTSRENAWQREFSSANLETQLAMAKQRQADAQANFNKLSLWMGKAQNDTTVKNEQWERAKSEMHEAFQESEKFKDVVHNVSEAMKEEAKAKRELAPKEAALEDAKHQAESRMNSVFAGGYQSNGNSLARVGLMASSPAVKGIEITAKNTGLILKAAQDILKKVGNRTVAVAG